MFPSSEKFEQHCNQILEERNALYKDAWKETGLQGAVIEIHAKWARLKQLVLKKAHGKQFTDAEILSIRDSLDDMHNYCLIANECLMGGFWFVDEADSETTLPRAERIANLLDKRKSE